MASAAAGATTAAAAAGSSAASGAAGTRRYALATSLTQPLFTALLTAALKRAVFRDASVTDELIESTFCGDGAGAAAGEGAKLSPDAARALVKEAGDMLAAAARANLSAADLRLVLEASDASAAHREVAVEFWKVQLPKVRAHVLGQSSWIPTVKRTAYRVDVLTSSRTSKDLSEPTAILELRTGQRADAPTSGSGSGGGRRGEGVVRFEMNREQLAAVLKQVEAAEAVIARSTA